ncbi:MAG: hypothetical protein MJY82_08610 [Fibrobacter sp.]|nr:hypothetical protein [Fibrobacter sp.]
MKKFLKTLSAVTIASFAGAFTACGEDSTAGVTEEAAGIAVNSSDSEDEDLSSSSKKATSSSSKDDASSSSKVDEPVKFSGKVSGVSQKGPFVVGSQVTLHELDGESFDLSGRIFVNKIKNDKGEFEVSYKDLSSNYVLLIAEGYYRNEVTGKKSVSPITLNALSDLTYRKTVNVNILTHLEFERVKYLTMSKGIEYGKAKAQAEKEILETFGISFKDGSSAEDLNIFGDSENDGALLALSVLMQGTSAEGDFSERLSLVAQDLEEDGTIDDEQMLTDIADEVALMDLDKVRKNIEGWKLSSTVPAFESYVEGYWTHNYGIGDCTAEDIAKTAKNTNKLSKNFEKTYVCDADGWREMGSLEEMLGTCTSVNDHAGIADADDFYACNKSVWKTVDRFAYDSLTLACEKDGNLLYSELNDVYYVCKNGTIAAPSFGDLDIEKDFTADIWNGAKDSKMMMDDGEYEGVVFASDDFNGTYGDVYNSKGEKVGMKKNSRYLDMFTYDAGVSSTLADKGVKYSFLLKEKLLSDLPFVSAKFNLSEDGADASDWEGLCVVYASSVPLYLGIDGTADDQRVSDIYKRLPASKELTVANVAWEDFAGKAGDKSYEEFVKKLTATSVIMMKNETLQAYAADAGSVYVAGIGKYNGCSVK